MTLNRVPDYLDHMLEAALQACAYVEGLSKEEFLDDKRTQQAVILNLILIGARNKNACRRNLQTPAGVGFLVQFKAAALVRSEVKRNTFSCKPRFVHVC